MKKMKYFLSAILVIGTLAGCGSDWNQDPLAGKDEAFKNGLKKPTLPESPKAVESGAVRVDTVDVYVFREGVMGEFPITARILESGYTPTLILENLNDFPGASYNASNGKFTWTPAIGSVSGDKNLQDDKILKVRVIGNKPNSKVLVGTHSIPIKVSKALHAPEIFSVSKTNANMREGESMNVTVKVRDKDAGNDVRTYPNLLILPITGYANLSQFVTITQVLAVGNNEFIINLSVDLSAAELTKSRDRFGFTLKALSRFQQASGTQDVYITVFTSFSDPQSTWFDVLEVPVGVKKEFQFIIFDPKEEMFVATPTFTNLPSGAQINCSSVGVTRQFCTFYWTPDFTVTPGDYTAVAQVTAKNQDGQDTFTRNRNFDLKLRVISAPPVNPLTTQGGK